MIEKQEFQEWEQHPVTKQVKAWIEQHRTNLSIAMASGMFLGNELEAARVVGMCQNMTEFLENTFELWAGIKERKDEDRV